MVREVTVVKAGLSDASRAAILARVAAMSEAECRERLAEILAMAEKGVFDYTLCERTAVEDRLPDVTARREREWRSAPARTRRYRTV